MLCPICLGRGWTTEEEIKEYPLRCEECHGKGKVSIDWHSYKCGVCDGTEKKELTNQLYIQNCTLEELAEFLTELILSDKRFKMVYTNSMVNKDKYYEMRMWLKEKKE